MHPKRHPMDDFADHPVLFPSASGTTVPANMEASARSDRRPGRRSPRSQGGECEQSIARPGRRSIHQQLAALRAALRLPLPRINFRTAYAAIGAKAVTGVTLAASRCAGGAGGNDVLLLPAIPVVTQRFRSR